MPQSEARKDDGLYLHLHSLSLANNDLVAAVAECIRFRIVDPDPAHLSPEQLDQEIDLVSRALFTYRRLAYIMVNLHESTPDFTPSPSRSDFYAITNALTPTADDQRDGEAMHQELKTITDYERSLDQNEAPE